MLKKHIPAANRLMAIDKNEDSSTNEYCFILCFKLVHNKIRPLFIILHKCYQCVDVKEI